MDKETEVLTKRGWISIETLYNNPEEIAVFSQKREIFFEKPSAMNGYYHSGGMITFNGKQVNQFVTPNHKMVYHSNNTLYVKEARDLYRHKNPKIPTAGNYVGGSTNLKDWQIKLLVAIQADAEILNDNSVKFRFAKERKVKRLMEIIREGNLKYKYYDFVEVTSSENIVSSIVIHNVGEIISLFRGDKKWNSWLLDFSRNNLELFVDELSFWDGSYTESYCHKREDYCSKYKQNVLWVKTICHLVGKQASIAENSSVWRAGINAREYSIASDNCVTAWEGMVYCPTVSTGMFLVRRKGKISVTHNSANYGITEGRFILNILEKSGGKIVLTKDEGRHFLQTYRGLFPEIPERNERIKEQVKKHKLLYNLFGHPYIIRNENITEETYKEYYAWTAQSTVAEITRTAYCDMQEYIWDTNKRWDVLIDGHDSIVMQCPLREVKEADKQLETFMNIELTAPSDGTKFRMKSESMIGFNWGKKKGDSNPLGLQEPEWFNN